MPDLQHEITGRYFIGEIMTKISVIPGHNRRSASTVSNMTFHFQGQWSKEGDDGIIPAMKAVTKLHRLQSRWGILRAYDSYARTRGGGSYTLPEEPVWL